VIIEKKKVGYNVISPTPDLLFIILIYLIIILLLIYYLEFT